MRPAKVTRTCVVSVLALVVALGSGCRREPPAIEKALLARLPTTYLPKSAVLSEDGKAYAFVIQDADGERVVTAEGISDVHAQCAKPAFALKSDRLFYWTRDGARDQPIIAIVANGTPIATDFIAAGEVAFSEDGSRWLAAGAGRGPVEGELGDITLFVDGVPMARVRDMALPSFSRDARHVAYLTATEGHATLVVDGEERQQFAPPTTECGAAALRTAPRPDLPLRHVVKFLADGTLLVVTRDPDGWGVYIDGRRIASYPRATIDHAEEHCATAAALAPRSLRVAERAPVAFWWERVAGDAEVWRMVRNGQPVDDITCVEPWRRHPPEPSVDGQRVIYVCASKGPDESQLVFVVRDGVRYGPYTNVWGIAPTKNFTHVAYGATRGSEERPWAIYVDGEVRVEHLQSVWRPRVSEDGTTLAWEATLDDEGRGIFGINDRRLGTFDDVLMGPEFEPNDRIAWVVRRGRKLSRISVPVAAAGGLHRPRIIVRH